MVLQQRRWAGLGHSLGAWPLLAPNRLVQTPRPGGQLSQAQRLALQQQQALQMQVGRWGWVMRALGQHASDACPESRNVFRGMFRGVFRGMAGRGALSQCLYLRMNPVPRAFSVPVKKLSCLKVHLPLPPLPAAPARKLDHPAFSRTCLPLPLSTPRLPSRRCSGGQPYPPGFCGRRMLNNPIPLRVSCHRAMRTWSCSTARQSSSPP